VSVPFGNSDEVAALRSPTQHAACALGVLSWMLVLLKMRDQVVTPDPPDD
jgi:hypothetical protein